MVPSIGPNIFAVKRNLSLLKTIPVGFYPKSVSISPNQMRAYICNLEGGSVDIVDATSLKLIKRVRFNRTLSVFPDGIKRADFFEEKPVEIGFTEKGRYVWISLLKAGGIVVHDVQGKRLPRATPRRKAVVENYLTGKKYPLNMRFIPTGDQPKIIAVSPDEQYVFVANWRGRNVTVIDAHQFKVVKKIKTGANPRGICFSATSAYVANFGSNTISEIDLKTLKKTRDFRNVGKNPRHLVLSPDGTSLYVSNHGDQRVRQIDLTSGRLARECRVGKEPRTICYSRSKNFLFVTNYKDDTLSAVDLDSMASALTIDTLRRPIGASFDSLTNTLWVTGYWDKAVRVYKFETTLERQVQYREITPASLRKI
jgi:YVTN family beta-propeller protein